MDAGWVFCTPVISAGYPRRFFPHQLDWVLKARPDHGNSDIDDFTDAFGNKNYGYAVGIPGDLDLFIGILCTCVYNTYIAFSIPVAIQMIYLRLTLIKHDSKFAL